MKTDHSRPTTTTLIAAVIILVSTWTPTGAAEVFTQTPKIAKSHVITPGGKPTADRDLFNVLPGFQVELLYTVPKNSQGSWVSITIDPKGRILASDQGGKGIYRITPAPIGSKGETKIEKLDIKITSAHGMLCAFDSLYLSINGGPGSGLYRARDTNGDDQYDEVVKLRPIAGGGEHGPHALRLSPDGKSIYIVCGNHTDLPKDLSGSRLPTNWGEDLLLPRQWDARGHARGRMAPGGWIAKTDPDGKSWEIVSSGYRNSYDMDFNADGELFVYDADMEWDMGTPWYRPTRVVHATSGSEFGWRSGTGKWPAYYIDSLPALVNTGPGSPVGVSFGYGAKFPAKYQKALYILDWTFSTIYAIHLQPAGASYRATKEEFVSRTPLPLTDVAVAPDGALYFTVGGRGAQSELFRVTYVGEQSTVAVDAHDKDEIHASIRTLRHKLEAMHGKVDNPAEAIDFLWTYLGCHDRHIRYAARIALENQPPALWEKRFQSVKNPTALMTAVVATARQGDKKLHGSLVAALNTIDFGRLLEFQQLDLLRTYGLVFIRTGAPDQATAAKISARLDPFYPAKTAPLNRELSRLLVYLKSPTVIGKTLKLMSQKSTFTPAEMTALLSRNPGYGGSISTMLANHPDIEKIHYALALRTLRYGWTLEQRKEYFSWLDAASKKSGGASYGGFINNIRKEALANASDVERAALGSSVIAVPNPKKLPKPAGPGHDWKLDELVALGNNKLSGRNFDHGKRTFAAAKCVVCHRFAGEGGATGPDLTNVAGRFSFRDLGESLLDPSKVISDQYRASIVLTTDGDVHTGRIAGERDGVITILIDPEDGSKVVKVAKADIDSQKPSAVSLMPADLLKTLNEQELLDLMAFMLSRGNPNDRMFGPE